MLRSIVVCPDLELSAKFCNVLEQTAVVHNRKTMDRYPLPQDILRTARAQAVDVLFLSFEDQEKASGISALLESEVRYVEIVALHGSMDAAVLHQTMRLGIREFIAEPFDFQEVADSLSRIRNLVGKRPQSNLRTTQVFSFLPAKAGVGTSTVALNTAAAMSRDEDTRVLLADFDLSSGMLRFLLKRVNQRSVVDAMENIARMDEHIWRDLVTTVDGTKDRLDVLHSGVVNPSYRIDHDQIRELAAFMGRAYGAIVFDLSGNLERYSMELMSESKRILLVCTPEVASLHLAREKLAFLRKMDLEGRVSIVLNRLQKRSLFTQVQVEEMLGLPVAHSFPNDYVGINEATRLAQWINPASGMGRSFETFARELRERPAIQAPARAKHKFLEYLAPALRTLHAS